MHRLKLLLPFIVILAVLGGTMRGLAFISGEPYRPFNPEREGARILEHRARLEQGEYPRGYDFYFAGTSRTMADFAPGAVANVLDESCATGHSLKGYNLGNVADDYGAFYKNLRAFGAPRLLVLELMPGALLADPFKAEAAETEPPGRFNRLYRDYKTETAIFETYVTGEARELLGLGDLITIRPGQLMLLAQAFEGSDPAARLYYAFRNFQGNGSRLADDGQVYYRSYLPDLRAAELSGNSGSEFQAYRSRLLREPPDAQAWQSFVNILDLFGSGRQVVVVRAPVDRMMYALEQQTHGELMARAAQYLQRRGVAYIDLNPGDYRSTDYSHIDWYDTGRLSLDFARRLARAIDCANLSTGSGAAQN